MDVADAIVAARSLQDNIPLNMKLFIVFLQRYRKMEFEQAVISVLALVVVVLFTLVLKR